MGVIDKVGIAATEILPHPAPDMTPPLPDPHPIPPPVPATSCRQLICVALVHGHMAFALTSVSTEHQRGTHNGRLCGMLVDLGIHQHTAQIGL